MTMIRNIAAMMLALLLLGACAPNIPGETVSREEFDRLKPGMTYDDVVKTIGGEPHDPTGEKGSGRDGLNILHAQPEFGGSIGLIMMDGKLKEAIHTPPTDSPLLAPAFFGSLATLLFAVFSTFFYFYKKNWPDAERKQPKLWKRVAIASWIIGLALFILMMMVA